MPVLRHIFSLRVILAFICLLTVVSVSLLTTEQALAARRSTQSTAVNLAPTITVTVYGYAYCIISFKTSRIKTCDKARLTFRGYNRQVFFARVVRGPGRLGPAFKYIFRGVPNGQTGTLTLFNGAKRCPYKVITWGMRVGNTVYVGARVC